MSGECSSNVRIIQPCGKGIIYVDHEGIFAIAIDPQRWPEGPVQTGINKNRPIDAPKSALLHAAKMFS